MLNGFVRRDVPSVPETANPLAPAIPVVAGIQSQRDALPKLHGALLTIAKPLETLPQDVVLTIPAGSMAYLESNVQFNWVFRAGIELPKSCTGFRIIGITYDDLRTMVSINGQGLRRVIDRDVFDGLDIKRLEIRSQWFNADGPFDVNVIVQPWGFGGGGGSLPVPVILLIP